MSRKVKVISLADRARVYAMAAETRIRLAEVSSGRPPNWELELAIAWMQGHLYGQIDQMAKEPKP